MTTIDSANMRCDGCGVSANHPIMYMPDGWIVDQSVNSVQHFCSICKHKDTHKRIKILHGYHTSNDPCKGPVPCRMCGISITPEDHWASDEEDWFYCERCWKRIEAKERETFHAIKPAIDAPATNTPATHIHEAARCYDQAYTEALVEFEGFVVQSVSDAAKLDQLANDAAVLFRRYLTARIDYKMITSPIDRSVGISNG